jgi:RNA polymerase sigma factor (sigma-70 family)
MSLPPFQTFVDSYGGDVWRFLVALVGRPEAEECWQETFLSALKAYPRAAKDSNLKSWVLTIAQRKAMDSFRATKRRPVPVPEVPDRARDSTYRDPELWTRVGALPEKQRLAIVHRFVSDLRYAEIGPLIGSSEAAARRSVHEGLKKLREEMQ